MIKYFASAFHNLQIALFAIKNQNQNIHTIPAIANIAAVATRFVKICSEDSGILNGLSLLFGRYPRAHTAHLQGFES